MSNGKGSWKMVYMNDDAGLLTKQEYAEIHWCFKRVNKKVEGFLDLEELLQFMDLRNCHVKQWEAAKMLEHADSQYHYYISLEQIVELASRYGIGTKNPVKMTYSEFDASLRSAFNAENTPSDYSIGDDTQEKDDNVDFNGAKNFFEGKVEEERQKEEYEIAFEIYRRNTHPYNANSPSPREEYIRYDSSYEIPTHNHIQYNYEEADHENSSPFLTPFNHQSSQGIVDDKPLEAVQTLKHKWEQKIQQQFNEFDPLSSNFETNDYLKRNEVAVAEVVDKVVVAQPQVDVNKDRTNKYPLSMSIPLNALYKRGLSPPPFVKELMLKANEMQDRIEARLRLENKLKKKKEKKKQGIGNKNSNLGTKLSKVESIPKPRRSIPPPMIPKIPKEWLE